jgi:hypothetical protein
VFAVEQGEKPVPHVGYWQYITYGFTDVFGRNPNKDELSGHGFELSFRVRMMPDEILALENLKRQFKLIPDLPECTPGRPQFQFSSSLFTKVIVFPSPATRASVAYEYFGWPK